MKQEEIRFGDLNRWLFGEAPPEFLVEVLIRTFLIYLFLLLIIRVMGKRMAGQMTLTEIAVMVTLGAIVSPVMQLPDRGILMGFLVLTAACFFQRGLNFLEVKNRRAEEVTQGKATALIKEGQIQLDELKRSRISKQQLYAMLRKKSIFNLGKVKRAYLEANGLFTVYTGSEDAPGLPIFPHTDDHIIDALQANNLQACCNCGHVQNAPDKNTRCNNCGVANWSAAHLSKAS